MGAVYTLTNVAQVACPAIGVAAGAAGLSALVDGRFAAGRPGGVARLRSARILWARLASVSQLLG